MDDMKRGTGKQPARVVPGEIGIDNFSFTPREMSIAIGESVTWRNHDDVPHQIVSVDRKFTPSSVLDTGQTYRHTFDRAGTFAYFCSLHPTMTGTVVVRG